MQSFVNIPYWLFAGLLIIIGVLILILYNRIREDQKYLPCRRALINCKKYHFLDASSFQENPDLDLDNEKEGSDVRS
jgi:hypothetical protein